MSSRESLWRLKAPADRHGPNEVRPLEGALAATHSNY